MSEKLQVSFPEQLLPKRCVLDISVERVASKLTRMSLLNNCCSKMSFGKTQSACWNFAAKKLMPRNESRKNLTATSPQAQRVKVPVVVEVYTFLKFVLVFFHAPKSALRASSDADHRIRRSFLGEAVLLDYCDGVIQAVGVVRYARHAQRDGLSLQMIDRFANCGGSTFENCARDLKEVLRSAGSEEFVTELGGPIYKFGILPSNVIKLIGRTPGQFKKRLAPSADAMQLFWEDFFSSETGMAYKNLHPFLRNATAQQLRSKFPMRIHQDAGPFSKNLSVDCIGWSSLYGEGNEMETKSYVMSTSRCMNDP